MVSYKGARVAKRFINQDALQNKQHRCHHRYHRCHHGEQSILLQGVGIYECWRRRSDIGLRKEELSRRDLTTCEYVEDFVHKIPFDLPWDTPAIHLSNLGAIVQQCYSEVKADSNSTIAYKGGHIERDLLRQLGIPSVNLEWFGCPKAEKLFLHLEWKQTCGNHRGLNAYHHCAKVEVEAFAHWLRHHQQRIKNPVLLRTTNVKKRIRTGGNLLV